MENSSLIDIWSVVWRGVVLYALVCLLLIMSVVSFSYPVIGAVSVPFFLMVIYYWGIYRPTLLPFWLVFLSGIFIDLITANPLGLNTLILLGLFWFIIDQRRYLMGQSFPMIWIGFALLSFGYALLRWGFFSAIHATFLETDALWISVFLSVGFFPIIYMLLHLTHKVLPTQNAYGQSYGELRF